MPKTVRPRAIVANWKMNKTIEEAVSFSSQLLPLIQGTSALVYIAPAFTAIQALSDSLKESSIKVGAQNMNDVSAGSFTGEIAALMLKEVGAQFVILGHSERRRLFGEDNELINRKVHTAFEAQLQPIVCIGETLEEREEGKTETILKEQLEKSLAGITPEQLSSLFIAYEPVWAIGTGVTSSPEEAQKVHHYCRHLLNELSEGGGNLTIILYGGSVRPDNVKALLDQPDIDGVLVGGASLSAETFAQIINA